MILVGNAFIRSYINPHHPEGNAFIRSYINPHHPEGIDRYVENDAPHNLHPEGMQPTIYAFCCIPTGCSWGGVHPFLPSSTYLRHV